MAGVLRIDILDSISSLGDGSVNEDIVGWTKNCCWVIDGATPVTANLLHPVSDARWLAEFVSHQLRLPHFTQSIPTDFSPAVGGIARAVQKTLNDLNFPENSLPPACSVGVVAVHDGRLTMGLVGDVSVYSVNEPFLLCDPRFGEREKKARQTFGPNAAVSDEAVRSDIAKRRREYIDGPGDMYLLSSNQRVVEGVRTRVVDVAVGDRILLLSDGFARAIEPYGLFSSYPDLVSHAEREGLPAVLTCLRAHEETLRLSGDSHFKRADDASAVFVEIT